jgi:hypothetical protein
MRGWHDLIRASHGHGQGHTHGERHNGLGSDDGGRVGQLGRRHRRGRRGLGGRRGGRSLVIGGGRGGGDAAAGLSTLGRRRRGGGGGGDDGDLELHARCAVARDGADEVVVIGGGKLDGGAAVGVGLDGVAAGAGVVAGLGHLDHVVGRRVLESCTTRLNG